MRSVLSTGPWRGFDADVGVEGIQLAAIEVCGVHAVATDDGVRLAVWRDVEAVGAILAIGVVLTRARCQFILAFAAIDAVVRATVVQGVVARTSVRGVVTTSTLDGVVVVLAKQEVDSAAAAKPSVGLPRAANTSAQRRERARRPKELPAYGNAESSVQPTTPRPDWEC